MSLIICLFLMTTMLYADNTIIKKNQFGRITSVKFIQGSTTTSKEFFDSYLHVRGTDEFRQTPTNNFIPNVRFERYQQYYKGLIVDGAHYTFEYKDGMMLKAHGNYVPLKDINVKPAINEEKAKDIYAECFDMNRSDVVETKIELLIKDMPDKNLTHLAYKVYMMSTKQMDADIAYIDAQTGELLCVEPSSYSYSTTGLFSTYYHGSKTGTTEWDASLSKYKLTDTTRGQGIHTGVSTSLGTNILVDNNNVWEANEFPITYGNMALDVHWTMEQIFDALWTSYGQYGYNGSGGVVQSYVSDNGDTKYSHSLNTFFFNNGQSVYFYPNFKPLATVDVIGHEYGHAILHHTTGWTASTDERAAMHEGFADIWGIIFESKITPNANIWATGEDAVVSPYSCRRNFANPSDPYAYEQISSTYNYWAIHNTDPKLSGGIAPRWFYLLVNGGSGINGNGQSYSVSSATMYDAQLIVAYAVLHPCLEDATSFNDVREILIDVSLNYMNSTTLAGKVASAWYAVGVGNSPNYAPQHDMETGTTSIDINPQTEGKGVIYNLNGQKLQSKPTKGVYIQSGRKYLLK